MSRDDLQALKTPLIAFAITLVASFIFTWYSDSVAERAHKRLAEQEAQLRAARLRIQNAGEEKEMIGRYLTPFRQLEQAGFVGEEQRINWLDGLRMANQQANIYGVEYEITPQRSYAYAAEFNPGPLLLKQSVMRLRLRLLHEEDLPRFLQALSRQGSGYFSVDECVMRRTQAADSDAGRGAQPNLIAECELSWLTATPPASGTEKKG